MTLKLILADEDAAYVEDVIRYIRASEWRHKLITAAYTDPGLVRDLREDRPHAILLATPTFADCAERWKGGVRILLSDEPRPSETADAAGLPAVNKYQPVEVLLRQVLAIFYEQSGAPLPGAAESGKAARSIAVYAASGGSGKTATALNLAKQLAGMDYKVFYLNMEGISSFSPAGEEDGSASFARVLYTLRGGHSFAARMGQLVFHDERWRTDMFHPPRHPGEWAEYGKDDVKRLLETLGREGGYDYVVADLDATLTEAVVGAMEHCTDLLWLSAKHETGRIKEQNAELALQRLLPEKWETVKLKRKFAEFPGDAARRTEPGEARRRIGGAGDKPGREGTDGGLGGEEEQDGFARMAALFVAEDLKEGGGSEHAPGLH